MRDAPLHHDLWHRVAPLRPSLAPGVGVYRHVYRGRPWTVLREPLGMRHLRIHETAARLLDRLDGRVSVGDAWESLVAEAGDAVLTQPEVVELLAALHGLNLLRGDLPPDGIEELRRADRERRQRRMGRWLSVVAVRTPLLDPDPLLERWLPVYGPAFARRAVLWLWLPLVMAGLFSVLTRFDELSAAAGRVLDPSGWQLVSLFVVFAVVKALHEIGHAMACKALGRAAGADGAVHDMGILWIALLPIPYVDASSAWALRSKWQRAAVGAAGMYVELAVASVAALIWSQTGTGWLNDVCFHAMILAGVTTLGFNLNPLLRFDGYFIASDLLELPNLYSRSREYLLGGIKRRLFGVEGLPDPSHVPSERPWLACYAMASSLYRVFVSFWILYFLSQRGYAIGAGLALVGAVVWLGAPLLSALRYLQGSPELEARRGRAVLVTLAGFALLVGLLGFVPVADRGRAEGVVQASRIADVFLGDEGRLLQILPSGTSVAPDEGPLLVARNPDLEAALAEIEAELSLAEVELRSSLGLDPKRASQLERDLDVLRERRDSLSQRVSALRVDAPFAGTWVAPELAVFEGAIWSDVARPLGFVARFDEFAIRAVADQTLGPRVAAQLAIGSQVEVRLRGRPRLLLHGEIEAVVRSGLDSLPTASLGQAGGGALALDPADPDRLRTEERFFEIRIRPLGDAPTWLHGERAVVRFSLPPKPLLAQWWRGLRQLLQQRESA